MPQNSHVLDSPAAKVLAVLSTVARLQAAPVSAIAQELGLPVATAHRICVELERLGYIRRVAGSRQWSVAKPLVDLASTILSAGASEAATHAILNRITHQTGEMCSFAVQVGDEVVYVASTEAPHTVTVSFRAGRRAPLFCTSSGRLFLSRLSDKAVMHYLEGVHLAAYTPYTLTAPKKLMTVIRRTREQGYAITNQEYVLHVVGAAVPIEDEHGLFYGALSLAAPDVRQSPISLEKLIPSLSDTGAELAKICELNACPAPSRGPSRLHVRL
jgi:IclR family transcriptional regulator, acetate operon repressor